MNRAAFAAALVLPAFAAGYFAGSGHRSGTATPPAPPAPAVAAAAPPNADFVRTALPRREQVPQGIAVTGKLALDQRRVRIAAARVAGRLGRIFVFEGQSVRAGAPLAELYSPEYISAENELLLARRFREAAGNGATPELHTGFDGDDAVRAGAERLRTLGASDADIAELQRSGKAAQYLVVRAPISGVVTQRNVDAGGYLNIGDPLMTLADTDALWLSFDTYDSDYAALRLGQTLQFQASALPGEQFSGRVSFIAPTVDAATHTLPVRCDIDNPGLHLRPGMFVSGKLLTGEAPAWVVPQAAVLHQRDRDYLFVQDDSAKDSAKDGSFRRIEIHGRPLDDGDYAVSAGLDAAVPVVVEGAVLLQQQAGEAGPGA